MNPTIRAYRFWHIFTFFHNFLLKKQLLWRNRGDIHTFVSDAIYCRSAGKLTLYVSNVDILMKKKKKSTPKILQLRKKIFLCRNTDVVSWEWQVSASGFQSPLQGRISAQIIYSMKDPGFFCWWFWWCLLGSSWWWKITRHEPTKQSEPVRWDWEHEVAELYFLCSVKAAWF